MESLTEFDSPEEDKTHTLLWDYSTRTWRITKFFCGVCNLFGGQKGNDTSDWVNGKLCKCGFYRIRNS